MICSVLLLSIYTPLEAYCSITIAWAAHRYGQSPSALLINILLGSFQLFLHSDQPLSEGEIILFSGTASRGRLHYPRRRRWWLHALTDRLLWCATGRRPAATSSRRASFSALASANPFALHRAEHHADASADASNCRVRQRFSSSAFLPRWAVGNGVITVMINSPWQADDDADNQSGDNAVTLLIHQISLTVPPAWILQSGCQPYARTDHNQRPAVKPRYCCNGRLPDGYHHDQSGKAPRSLICCNGQRPDFRREVFQAKLLAVGIPLQRERSR